MARGRPLASDGEPAHSTELTREENSMPITENVRKVLADATPLYAVAGTVDLAAEKLREVPPLIDKVREQAPEQLEKIRTADPKTVQENVAKQAKDVQAKLTEKFGGAEADFKKLRDTAQEFALQQVGRAAEYAVKAGEKYNGLVDRGRGAVKTWRGEAAEEVAEISVAIKPAEEEPRETEAESDAKKAAGKKGAPKKSTPGKSAE
jgi:heparin binding hemagglutinin HbhA